MFGVIQCTAISVFVYLLFWIRRGTGELKAIGLEAIGFSKAACFVFFVMGFFPSLVSLQHRAPRRAGICPHVHVGKMRASSDLLFPSIGEPRDGAASDIIPRGHDVLDATLMFSTARAARTLFR